MDFLEKNKQKSPRGAGDGNERGGFRGYIAPQWRYKKLWEKDVKMQYLRLDRVPGLRESAQRLMR